MDNEGRQKRVSIIAHVLRSKIDATGYGSWVSDDTIKDTADAIQTAIEEDNGYESEDS